MANNTAAPTDPLAEDFPGRDKLEPHGIRTYQDVAGRSDDELLALDGIGKATLKSIRAASPTSDEAKTASGPEHELVPVRVNRERYYRNGNTYQRNARIQVPRYVLDDIAEREENPPTLVEIQGEEA